MSPGFPSTPPSPSPSRPHIREKLSKIIFIFRSVSCCGRWNLLTHFDKSCIRIQMCRRGDLVQTLDIWCSVCLVCRHVCVCSQLIKKHGNNLFTQNTNTSANTNTHTWRRTLLIRRVACLIFSSIQSATFSEIFYFHSVLLFAVCVCLLPAAHCLSLIALFALILFRYRLFILSTFPFFIFHLPFQASHFCFCFPLCSVSRMFVVLFAYLF